MGVVPLKGWAGGLEVTRKFWQELWHLRLYSIEVCGRCDKEKRMQAELSGIQVTWKLEGESPETGTANQGCCRVQNWWPLSPLSSFSLPLRHDTSIF